ncbi:EF-hand [Penicillium chermesinum]|uniref:EF-hand n=1 Tax=Penicillium chermesinum TaxID=63820 RepID=A0A9W9TFB5_9EURO|nr:EF-hand [Penicillium chermesinum]KAJ5220294.1 EF-hand [Penicillium chermesinum]
MAYNKSYNPDALPAHAEPEQVAQMIGSMQVSGGKTTPAANAQKPLPGRPPSSKPGSVPPRVPVGSGGPPPNPYTAPNPYTSSTPRPQDPAHSYNGRAHPSANGPSSHGLPSQTRPHPLHPSPPPQNYGFGPPPPKGHANRPPPLSRPPQSPNPPPLTVPSDDPQQLLGLVNGDYTSFHPRTVKMMIRMFDRNGNGVINFDEFVSLWRYLAAWRELFDRFDEDRSGRISLPEFEKALVAFGYRLSQPFVSVLFKTFESKTRQLQGQPRSPNHSGMSFDLFVQACISLKRMTDVFKQYDDDRDGYITVSFEEFLTEILQLQD